MTQPYKATGNFGQAAEHFALPAGRIHDQDSRANPDRSRVRKALALGTSVVTLAGLSSGLIESGGLAAGSPDRAAVEGSAMAHIVKAHEGEGLVMPPTPAEEATAVKYIDTPSNP